MDDDHHIHWLILVSEARAPTVPTEINQIIDPSAEQQCELHDAGNPNLRRAPAARVPPAES
jgi:desulfoferrodoxin (superoxide reductase-like protein)